MDFGELKALTLQRLNDPTGSSFPEAFREASLRRVIQNAYDQLVQEVETGSAWNIVQTPLSISVLTDTREYDLDPVPPAPGIRKPIECVPFITGREGYPLPEIPFLQRNRAGVNSQYLQLSSRSGGGTIYFYRDSSQSPAMWRLGFEDQSPIEQTVRVYYSPAINRLVSDGDVPVQIPDQWHALIPTYAALMVKVDTKRDAKDLAALHSVELARMKRDVASTRHAAQVEGF